MRVRSKPILLHYVGCFTLALVALPFALRGGEPAIMVIPGWVQAVPPGSADSVAYLKLVNRSGQPLRLSGATTPLTERVMPMQTIKQERNGHEIVGMRPVDALVVPAHDSLELQPEGAHLMLMGLKDRLRPGAKVKLTLHFEPGGIEVTTDLPVAMTRP